MSLNFPVEIRRSRDRVRVLTVTEAGVPAKDGLRYILDDLVTSSTAGVVPVIDDGEKTVVFTDVAARVSDYHESTSVSDGTGQNGTDPCNLCSILRFRGQSSVASRYAFTTDVHSTESSYARTTSSSEISRSCNFSDEDLATMCLSRESDANAKNSLLIYYHNEVNKALE